jgi:hypothetical protein
MQRRSFLGSLLGLAAAPALAQLSPILSPAVSMEMAPPLILPTIEGTGFVTYLSANAAPVAGTVRLMRTSLPASSPWAKACPMVLVQINAGPNWYSSQWSAGLGNEVVFTPDSPIAAVFPPGFSGSMQWETLGGDCWLRIFQPDGRVFDYLMASRGRRGG